MKTTGSIALAYAWFALIIAGCEKGEEPGERAGGAPESPTAEPVGKETVPAQAAATMTPTVKTHMKDHFESAQEIRLAIVEGDLKRANEKAVWLAEHELGDNLKEEWRSHAEAMKQAAKTLRDAATLDAAARGMGELGQACAECHQALGRPKLGVGAPPEEGSGTQPHMLRHQWAADRLWEGLMAPIDELWLAGSEAMADAPLEKEQLGPDESLPEAASELAKQVHEQASRARTAPPPERAAIYGELLGSCSNCHRELGVRRAGMVK